MSEKTNLQIEELKYPWLQMLERVKRHGSYRPSQTMVAFDLIFSLLFTTSRAHGLGDLHNESHCIHLRVNIIKRVLKPAKYVTEAYQSVKRK